MCWPRPLSNELINFLRQEFPENQHPNNLVVSSNPQNLRNKYPTNKKYLLNKGIYTIDQLANNQNVLMMIMSEVEVEQFHLAYRYRNNQRQEPLSQLPYENSGYTYRLELQNRLIDGRNVLVIGEKGSGKSTLINAIGNSLLLGYADKYRYHISDYDFNGFIQECDLDVLDIKFKFLEVLGYGQDLKQNHNIMLQTYEHLQKNNVQIDCIVICRRFGNQALNTKEKQIICHLAEIFGQGYINKCFLVNTNYDLGNQIIELLAQGLNNINQIYDLMPNPKILFVNSLTTPFEGDAGASRFETVNVAKNAIINLIQTNANRISIINQDAFRHRRQIENELQYTKNQIKISLVELLPCLENYFSICEVDENQDELFYANTIFWSTLVGDERIREGKELRLILEEINLPDQILTTIEQEQSQLLNSLTIDIDRQQRKRQEAIYKEKLRFLKNMLNNEKNNRLETILQLADDYINNQQHFLQQTYLHIEETREQLITSNMNNQLKLYLQQDQGLEIPQLQQEFEVIRQRLYLPNTNLFATQIIAI
ncbi:unnamed protein product [Paramecium pentaurelia]|uniref:Uncharacterized protein n=1 Tax=Paramecium pentaurelia TaxID=43138 RepID=A0A8S1W308_9CILI|nr:unnamed protein product [Paramecium pentaurelia]